MFKFKKKKPASEPAVEKQSIFSRLKQGLTKTRSRFGGGLQRLFAGKKQLDADTLAELEDLLLSADVGVEATESIIQAFQARVQAFSSVDEVDLSALLAEGLVKQLQPAEVPLVIQSITKPMVVLMVGINGSGKTTSMGKLAHYWQDQGHSVMLAAGDTFRAAAIEQLQVWGERNQVPVIAQAAGSDSAAVIYDAYQSAKAKGVDILLADTAGRLHTQQLLMDELKKIKRVLTKCDPDCPHEVMLVLDAGIGQNALQQAREFHAAVGVTGLTVTKLDGTAKGGVLFALVKALGLPIRFIGLGEQKEQLKPFVATDFVSAIVEAENDTV